MSAVDTAVSRDDVARAVLHRYRNAHEHQRIVTHTPYYARRLAWHDVLNRTANTIAAAAAYDFTPNPLDVAVWKTLDDALRKRFLADLERAS